MSQKSDKVKSGYTELSPTEKMEIKQFIENFDKSTINEQKTFSERLEKALNKSLGPKFETTCPCCNR